MLWSQMHGDETTATRTLFDLFNFFISNDQNNAERKFLLENLELHFIPMLNPDGAELYKRRNAQDIDINRDAQNLETPEARILMNAARSIKPDIGFNLHDQNILTSAGKTANTATISFLAPAFNKAKDMDPIRKRAMQLLLGMNNTLQKEIPGRIAKYDDTFDARCFGDTFQGMGISTVLIESGGYPGDPEKEYIRKLNFAALLTAFNAIADGSFQGESLEQYSTIPENGRTLSNVLIRNLSKSLEGVPVITNIAINHVQINDPGNRSLSYLANAVELPDAKDRFAYSELDASGLTYVQGKLIQLTEIEWQALDNSKAMELLKQGYLFVQFPGNHQAPGPSKDKLINTIKPFSELNQTVTSSNFLLYEGSIPKYAILNGFIISLDGPFPAGVNAYRYQ